MSSYDYECNVCLRPFESQRDANEHMDAKNHWGFYTRETRSEVFCHEECAEHMDNSDHRARNFECPVCDETFGTEPELGFHKRYYRHDENIKCETCPAVFDTESERANHMDALNHRKAFDCQSCDRSFKTMRAAEQHMAAKRHRRNYCYDCERQFDSENNLKMHLNSRVHRGASINCPFCKGAFATASGLSHHLETASCSKAPGVNKESIYNSIQSRDTARLVTPRQLEHKGRFKATENSWNGTGYKCDLCRREFGKLEGLNQHVRAVHPETWYHCPNGACKKEFGLLGALFAHLESESCGYIKFEAVGKWVGRFFDGRGTIKFGL